MNKQTSVLFAFAAATAIAVAPVSASADLLGTTVTESTSAVFESLAVQVKASQLMNSAEEVKVTTPTSKAGAELTAAGYDDKADDYKDKSLAAYDKASEYLDLANAAKSTTDRKNYTTAADNYEKTAYFYSVSADLYLSAQQKVLGSGASLTNFATSADKASDAGVRSLADAKVALTEAKAEVAHQNNTRDAIADANKVSTTVATTLGVTDAKNAITSLGASVGAKKDELLDLAEGYAAKAAASTGETKTTYAAVEKLYSQAALVATQSTTASTTAVSKFTNAVPENPVNPGDNLKWHMFQSNPDTALAVMKYNYAQFAMSAVRWQGIAQHVAQNPAGFLEGDRVQSDESYADGFRTSSVVAATESKDLMPLVSKYNDQIPTASAADADKWKQVSSYLVDIIVTYQEMGQSQYQIYTLLNLELGRTVQKASLIEKTAEVTSVLKAGEKKVVVDAEINSVEVKGKTQVDVYSTQPGEVVTITLSKAGSTTVTAKDTSDAAGLAEFNLSKSFVGFTATVKIDGKTVDSEKLAK